MQNSPGFIFPHTDTPKTCPVLGLNLRRRTFQGVYFCAPTRVRAKFVRFHISAHGYTKNAPDFTLPNRDAPKTRPVLYPNRRREVFRGVCNTPLHGYMKIPPSFIFPKHVPTKNAPDFIHPNKDTCKTRPVLHPNRRRGTFGGVCNTPLHGYVQNLAGFIFPHTNTPKTHLISPSLIGMHPKPI